MDLVKKAAQILFLPLSAGKTEIVAVQALFLPLSKCETVIVAIQTLFLPLTTGKTNSYSSSTDCNSCHCQQVNQTIILVIKNCFCHCQQAKQTVTVATLTLFLPF